MKLTAPERKRFIAAFDQMSEQMTLIAQDSGFWNSQSRCAEGFEKCCKRLGVGVDLGPAAKMLVNDVFSQLGVGVDQSDVMKLALIGTEVAEAIEATRDDPQAPDEHLKNFSRIESELADIVIRVMDLASARGYRLAEAIVAKGVYNASRPKKHGKKF